MTEDVLDRDADVRCGDSHDRAPIARCRPSLKRVCEHRLRVDLVQTRPLSGRPDAETVVVCPSNVKREALVAAAADDELPHALRDDVAGHVDRDSPTRKRTVYTHRRLECPEPEDGVRARRT